MHIKEKKGRSNGRNTWTQEHWRQSPHPSYQIPLSQIRA